MKRSSRSGALAGFWFAATSLVALQAGAQSTAEYDRLGPYLMVGIGYTFENFGFDPGKETPTYHVERRFDGSRNIIAHAGWRFHPHAAVDIGFEFNTGIDGSFENKLTSVRMDADFETYLTTIGVKIYALKGRIQPFLHPSIGVMVVGVDRDIPDDPDLLQISGGLFDRKTTPALRAGGGVDIYITENLFLSFSAYYVLPLDVAVRDAQYVPVSAAVGLRF
jgi:hypothetical protein